MRGKSIFSILKPYGGLVSILVVLALAGNGVNLVIPLIISHAIDNYSAGTFVLKTVVFQFVLAAALIMVFNYLQGLIQTYTSEKAARNIRTELANKISRQSFSYVIKANPSRLLTNLTSDIDSIKMFISQAFSSIVSSLFTITGASILLISINWKLGLAVLAIIPIIGSAFFMMLKKVRPLFRKSREVIDWLNRVINESIMGAMLIRILNSQHEEYVKFIAANRTSRDLGLSILNLFASLIPVINFVSNMAILTVLALGGHFVITGEMSLGNLAAFNNYIFILIFPIILIGFMSTMIAHANASYKRVGEVLNTPDIQDKGHIKADLKGSIEFKEVSLKFGEKYALKNINLKIEGGSNVAIIGPTAAGKTQLLNLLTGLIKPDTGTILYDGVSINEYDKESFYSQVGLVFQDNIIFSMSLYDNIAFGTNKNEELINRAIDTAELRDFVNSLPGKLDTVVSERGTSLSGGQKQRIMLARALALNPRILLLDDFTSRVDRRTEQTIMHNIQKNYTDLTILTVTQKIAPVEHFEQIILLMESEIIATGKHQKLLNSSPEYVQIFNSQRTTSHYDVQS